MAQLSRFTLSACATALVLSLGTAAHAHLITPFICTPSGTADGTSRWVNSGGVLLNQFTTVQNGESTTGLTLSDIDSNSQMNQATLEFDIRGTANLTNGPWVYAIGTDQNGNSLVYAAAMANAKKVRTISGGWTGTLGKTQFGVPSGTKMTVSEFVIQNFPSATKSSTQLFGMRVNGLTLVPVLSTKQTCPAGDVHP
ncbi:MAG TPA: hypothetical protein V6C81_21045 [Planktothrix sp.]|jgi:hypothetical protein